MRIIPATILAVISFAASSTMAQTQLDRDYERQQMELQVAIEQAAGSTRAAIVLPVSAFENPILAGTISAVVKDPESNLAIEGFDPVGYFTEGRATRGNPAFQGVHDGAVYYFANAEHREMFLASPERYLPAYGGYCTETLAQGALTPASPLHWTVHGDRLFLTRSAAANDVFREKRAQSIASADAHWAQFADARDNYNISAHAN